MPRERNHLLHDIVQEARLAQSFVANVDRPSFAVDVMRQHAVERALEIIGEALSKLDENTQRALADAAIPVRNAIAMRNRLAHTYWTTDVGLLWEAATEHMEPLLAAVQTLVPLSIEKTPAPVPSPSQRRPPKMG